MNKRIKALVAALMATVVISACSPQSGSTTTAGTTAAGDTDQTQGEATQAEDGTQATEDSTTAEATQAGEETTTGEATQAGEDSTTAEATQAGDSTKAETTDGGKATDPEAAKIKAFLEKAQTAMKGVSSFTISEKMTYQLAGQDRTTESVKEMDVKNNKGRIKGGVVGEGEYSYMDGSTVYMSDGMGGWNYIKGEKEVESELLPLNEKSYNKFKLTETADGFKLETKEPVSLDDLGDMPMDAAAPGQMDMDNMKSKIELTMTFSKDHLLKTMDMDIEVQSLKMKQESSYGKYNETPPVTIPEEVKKNAKEFSLPDMPEATKP